VVRDQCAVRFFGQALALFEEKLAIGSRPTPFFFLAQRQQQQ
jgi:hypothetical protein